MNHAAGAIVIPLSLPQHLAPSFSTELSRLCLCADDLFFQQPNSPPESPRPPFVKEPVESDSGTIYVTVPARRPCSVL